MYVCVRLCVCISQHVSKVALYTNMRHSGNAPSFPAEAGIHREDRVSIYGDGSRCASIVILDLIQNPQGGLQRRVVRIRIIEDYRDLQDCDDALHRWPRRPVDSGSSPE